MSAKIIIQGKIGELVIATFRTPNEATTCASLLQAQCNNPDYIYYVEYKYKGQLRRVQPDSFTHFLQYLNEENKKILRSYCNALSLT